MQLGDTRHWVGFTDYLIDNQEGPSYKATSKGVMGDQKEYSREKRRWRRVIFDRKDLMKRMRHHKDASSLGIRMDLVWEEVERTSKVVIVSFLYFIPWVSGLCNHFNIVFSMQLDRKEPLDSYLHLHCLWNRKCESIESKKTGTSRVSWEEHTIYCKRTPHTWLRSPLPPNIILLCSPWLPKNGMQGHFSIYIVDYSLQEPHLILWEIPWR